MTYLNRIEDPRIKKTSFKLRAAAVGLAFLGSVSAVWLALEGQKVRMQQAIFAERQVRFDSLGGEIDVLEKRMRTRMVEAAASEANLAEVRRQRDEAAAALASAASNRDKAEVERAAAVSLRIALLNSAETERHAVAQLKADTVEARAAYGIAQAEMMRVRRELERLTGVRAAAEAENTKLRDDRNELRKAIALLAPELETLNQQRAVLTAELERGGKRAESLRVEAQREQDRTAQLRSEVPELKLEAEHLRRQTAELRKEHEEFLRQRPALAAQVQTLQKQVEHLQNGVRQRAELVDQSEKRLSENFAKVAEADARRTTFDARAKELQDLIREHTKRAADDKREADRIAAELTRLHDQSRNLEPQRKEITRISSLRDQGERQLKDLEARLTAKNQELGRVLDDIKAHEEQRQKLSRLPSQAVDVAVQAKVETVSSDDPKLNPVR